MQLSQEVNAKKYFIQNFDNEEGAIRIKQAAKQETEFILQDNRQILSLSLSAVLEAIRLYPANQVLLYDLLTSGSTTFY